MGMNITAHSRVLEATSSLSSNSRQQYRCERAASCPRTVLHTLSFRSMGPSVSKSVPPLARPIPPAKHPARLCSVQLVGSLLPIVQVMCVARHMRVYRLRTQTQAWTQSARTWHGAAVPAQSISGTPSRARAVIFVDREREMPVSPSLSLTLHTFIHLSLSIYIYIYVCVYIYIYIYNRET